MIRRLFWLLLGLLFGVWLVRKVDAAARAARPTAVAERTGRSVGSMQQRVGAALAEGRAAKRAHDAALRERFDVPSLIDLAALERDDQTSDPAS